MESREDCLWNESIYKIIKNLASTIQFQHTCDRRQTRHPRPPPLSSRASARPQRDGTQVDKTGLIISLVPIVSPPLPPKCAAPAFALMFPRPFDLEWHRMGGLDAASVFDHRTKGCVAHALHQGCSRMAPWPGRLDSSVLGRRTHALVSTRSVTEQGPSILRSITADSGPSFCRWGALREGG